MRSIVLGTVILGLLAGVSAAEQPAATVGGQPISRSDLDTHIKAKLTEIENERYEALHDGLEELITVELYKQEAKARGVTVEALQQEITAKIAAPTDAEIQKVYDENEQEFVDNLRKKYTTVVNLQPPRVEVGTGGRPERGPKNAPITIIEFSDYECPFCKRAEQSVQQVLSAYGDKLRFVYRDFPLEIHAHARPASEAAHCAQAQGKFWEYHAKLLASSDLSDEKLKSLADEVGLDRAKFDECVVKQQFKADVDKDAAAGAEVGVTGTPAFFINGRMLSGAQSFEKFKEVIDEELAAKKGKSS
jgi:protein-disulfide isomerase